MQSPSPENLDQNDKEMLQLILSHPGWNAYDSLPNGETVGQFCTRHCISISSTYRANARSGVADRVKRRRRKPEESGKNPEKSGERTEKSGKPHKNSKQT